MSFTLAGCQKVFNFFLGNGKFSVCCEIVFIFVTNIYYTNSFHRFGLELFQNFHQQLFIQNNYSILSLLRKTPRIHWKSIKQNSFPKKGIWILWGCKIWREERRWLKSFGNIFNVWLLVPATLSSSSLYPFFIRWKVYNIFICFYRYRKLFLHHLVFLVFPLHPWKNCWRKKMICK